MRLVLLYGPVSNQPDEKQQQIIDGKLTCGYREYGRVGGAIVYLAPQKNIKETWEYCFPDGEGLIDWLNQYPEAVVWSVKNNRKKDNLLKQIKNFKLHYSCVATGGYNKYCDISLVDDPTRIQNNRCKVFFKGKDPDYWTPSTFAKKYDYVLMGRIDNKNQIYFIEQLNQIKEPRSVIWIGGKNYSKIVKTHHSVRYTEIIGQNEVRNLIPLAKVGILFTEFLNEGFPQSFLEMTISGVPVVYSNSGPGNDFYFGKNNCVRCNKEELIESAEFLLTHADPQACREFAVKHYGLQKAVDNLVGMKERFKGKQGRKYFDFEFINYYLRLLKVRMKLQ